LPQQSKPWLPQHIGKKFGFKITTHVAVRGFKKDVNNSLKEIQNTGKQVEALKKQTQKPRKELQENTTK